MFNTIVWATDGSPAAEKALPYVKSLAEQEGASIVVVHAVETYAGSRAAGLPIYVEEDELREKIQRQAAELESDGLVVEVKFVTGLGVRAAHAIADAAREVGADLIVTGTRGHTSLGGLMLGSVTQRLLHIARCPVMAVPAESDARVAEVQATVSAIQPA